MRTSIVRDFLSSRFLRKLFRVGNCSGTSVIDFLNNEDIYFCYISSLCLWLLGINSLIFRAVHDRHFLPLLLGQLFSCWVFLPFGACFA